MTWQELFPKTFRASPQLPKEIVINGTPWSCGVGGRYYSADASLFFVLEFWADNTPCRLSLFGNSHPCSTHIVFGDIHLESEPSETFNKALNRAKLRLLVENDKLDTEIRRVNAELELLEPWEVKK